MYGTLSDFEPLELQFDLFLVRTKVLRVSLKPNNSSIKRIRIKNDLFCSAIGTVFVVQINHINPAAKRWHKSNFFCSVISKLRDETKTKIYGLYIEWKEEEFQKFARFWRSYGNSAKS